MKKIYRGMQNAAEDIQANFDELHGIVSKDNIQNIFDGVVLWNETQSYSYDLNKLKVGVQLVFSRYNISDWTPLNYGYNTVTITKATLQAYNGDLFFALMPDANAGQIKRFRFSNNKIWGDADNSKVTGFALRKIIGY